jgi:hypothetical protein
MRKGKRFEFASRPQCRKSVMITRPLHTRLTQTMSFVDAAPDPCEPRRLLASGDEGRLVDQGHAVPH